MTWILIDKIVFQCPRIFYVKVNKYEERMNNTEQLEWAFIVRLHSGGRERESSMLIPPQEGYSTVPLLTCEPTRHKSTTFPRFVVFLSIFLGSLAHASDRDVSFGCTGTVHVLLCPVRSRSSSIVRDTPR
jgi:hypothetical protein